MIFSPNRFGVSGIRFPAKSIPLNDPIMKAWEYEMIAYVLKIPNPKCPFFSHLIKFSKCMFKRIHSVFTSADIPIKLPTIKFTY